MKGKAPAHPLLPPQRLHTHRGIHDAIGLMIYLDKPPDNPWAESLVTFLLNRTIGKEKKIGSQDRSLASKISRVEQDEDNEGSTTTPYVLHN